MTEQKTINAYILQAMKENASLTAFSDLKTCDYTYLQVAEYTAKFHMMFSELGIKPGDHIALCGKNSSRWAMAFIAALTYGAVVVPILHEFNSDSVHHLVDHSDAKLLFIDEAIWDKLNPGLMPKLKAALNIADYAPLHCASAVEQKIIDNNDARFEASNFDINNLKVYEAGPDDTALINYTSGSTGNSKGVMLTYRNLWSNAQYCIDGLKFLLPGDGTVCMLPLAHMFGLMVEMIHPFVKGCHINFITRVPSPRVIIDAFTTVKPKLIVTVPLVLEKIIKSRVMPTLRKPKMRLLLSLPFINNIVYDRVRQSIIEAFGGNVLEIIIGGAALSKDVEKLLRRMKFPYTVGYGMTECGPLIAYAPWSVNRRGACGRCVDRMEVKVDSEDPVNVPGILWVKGENVMNGYYKNPEATEAIMADGWMNTGDICTIDPDGFITIKGRDKNMILGPSGQNIYPEEIEQLLNNMPYVNESIVIDENGKLIALIHPDMEAVENESIDDEQLDKIMRDNIARLNTMVSVYAKVADMRIHREEFEKTPKRSIKRFLYQK